jgi:single-strand DNA-binding protein
MNMAGSINKVTLIGNLGRDPEIRATSTGRVANFTMATTESWKDKTTGERKEQTEWHRVVVFNQNLIDVIEKMLQKGTKVYIEGTLRTRKWTNQQGQDVYTTEVVLNQFSGQLVILNGAKALEGGEYGAPRAAAPSSAPAAPREEINVGNIGDDIPF